MAHIVHEVQKTFGWHFEYNNGRPDNKFLKDLEHRNACVGLAGNNQEQQRKLEDITAGNNNTL